MPSRYRMLPATVLAVLLLAACSSGASQTPAASASARTIEVAMTDELRFEPAEFTVRAGETVRFEVTNTGAILHDFFLGDEAEQAEHEDEMGGMSGMGEDGPTSLSVEPGETKTLEYTFSDDAGELLIGCHEPGHYDAGMVATVTIEE
jgi:uncharacterized cupredoxin-like copper-binding protein